MAVRACAGIGLLLFRASWAADVGEWGSAELTVTEESEGISVSLRGSDIELIWFDNVVVNTMIDRGCDGWRWRW